MTRVQRDLVNRTSVAEALGRAWGTRLAESRKAKGYSQLQLASEAEVSQQAISKIESGRVLPHDTLKLVLAGCLGQDPSDLWAWPKDLGVSA